MRVVKTEEVKATEVYVRPDQMEFGVIYESRNWGFYYVRVASDRYFVLGTGNIFGSSLMAGTELRRVPDTTQITISN